MAAEGGWAADDWLLICEDDLVFTDHGPQLLERVLSLIDAVPYDAALLDSWAPLSAYPVDATATSDDARALEGTLEVRRIEPFQWEYAIGAHALLLRVKSLAGCARAAYEGLQRAIERGSEPTVDPFYTWRLGGDSAFCVVSAGIVDVGALNWDGSTRDIGGHDSTSFWDDDAFWDVSRLQAEDNEL